MFAKYDVDFIEMESRSQADEPFDGDLFQVFVNSESESGDILIKMYDSNVEEERYMCVDLDDNAIDFCEPQDWKPTSFVLSVPAS